mgnify:CR=1 FL=1
MSEIRATTISDETGNGPIALTKQSAAKGWIKFDGTGTVSINDSFNVSSLTDNSAGNYSATVSNSLSNSDYSHVGQKQNVSVNTHFGYVGVNTSASVYNPNSIENSSPADSANMNAAIFGDLA